MARNVNGPLHWEQLGKYGLPMVFVHPNPMDHTCWVYQMAHFSTWFRTIGIDLPGYGRSPTAQPGLTMPDVAQACWEAVDEATDEPAILVGLSVGSNVVQHMANQRPERTLAVVVTGSGYSPGPKAFVPKRMAQYSEQGVVFREQHTFEDYSSAFAETAMARYFARIFAERNDRADAATIVEMFRALGEPDPEWLQTGIKAPTLIISGSEDSAHRTARALQERIPDCELAVIQGAGHACNMEQPWEYDAHLLRFLVKHGLVDAEVSAAPA